MSLHKWLSIHTVSEHRLDINGTCMVPFRNLSKRGAMEGSALISIWYTPYLNSCSLSRSFGTLGAEFNLSCLPYVKGQVQHW